ncbi:MAG: heparan-alpha-glucosaminide N-acetyltransferase [Tissierellia bacterium]|nr:heparan-alpha-glucosaminide N-acetyltransferase [Tissierellia bacterium]
MKRNYLLDQYRGFTLVSMVLFHFFYDLNLYWPLDWYAGTLFNRIWQLSIAMSFFIISGITSNFLSPERNIKRGIKTSLLGLLISLVTYFFAPDLLIVFGVLNGLGLAMVLGGLVQDHLKFNPLLAGGFLVLFTLTYTIPRGSFLGQALDPALYASNLFVLGFPGPSFYSTDYFPLVPWFFIYLFGLLVGQDLIKKDFYGHQGAPTPLAKIGQHSLAIYLTHQLVLYLLVTGLFKLLG